MKPRMCRLNVHTSKCEAHVIICFLTAQNVSIANIQKQLIRVYGEHIMSCQMVAEWRRKFLKERDEVYNQPRSGTPQDK